MKTLVINDIVVNLSKDDKSSSKDGITKVKTHLLTSKMMIGNPYRDSEGKFSTGGTAKTVLRKMVKKGTNEKRIADARKKAAESKKKLAKETDNTKQGIMSRKEADNATKDSKYQSISYHGTSASAAKIISKTGFIIGKEQAGRNYGDGVYLTSSSENARMYAQMADNNKGKVIGSKVDIRKPYKEKTKSISVTLSNGKKAKITEHQSKAIEYGKSSGIIDKKIQSPNELSTNVWSKVNRGYCNELFKKYDGLIFETPFSGDIIIVRDPSQIKIFEDKTLRESLKDKQ